MLDIIIFDIVFFVLPLMTVVFFVLSLWRYLIAKKKNKATPDTFSADEIKKRKILLVISSILAGTLLAAVIGFIVLIATAVAFM